ncbi:MAG: NUDIX hydrolase [Holophaga sp.]|nr:NUDIX hydrolase [Holophaga sp.]
MANLPPLPDPEQPNPYTVTERNLLFDSPWIRLREDRFRHRKGVEGRYPICGFRRTACGVLALDEQDQVILVGQWRFPLECYSWEIVEGGGEEHESPFECIQRELAEEANLRAETWEPLAYSNLSNSSTDEEAFLFLASGLADVHGHQPDDEEELRVHREPFEHCLRRVQAGEIADGLTVIAILALQARRSGVTQPLHPDLAERFFQRPAQHPSHGRARWAKLEAL